MQGNRISMSQSAQQTSPIPDEAFQLGELHHLGTPVATFKAHYTRSGTAYFYSQVAFLIFALAILLAAFIIFFIYRTHNVLWLFFLIIMLNSFNILNITRRKNKDQPMISPFQRHARIYVYQDGLISLRNKRPVVVRWEQVRQVRYIRPKSQYGRMATVTVVYVDRGATKRLGIASILAIAELDNLGILLEQMYTARKAGMQ